MFRRNLIKAIIWTNAGFFLVSLVFSGKSVGLSANPLFALSPDYNVLTFLGGSGTIPIDTYNAWWSLFTAGWFHGSLLHILFNMMALKTVAPIVINAFGPSRMFCIYILSGVLGFFSAYLGGVPLTVGASAGICGLIGALLYYGKSRGGAWGQQVFMQTRTWIFSLMVIGFIVPNIDNWGHGGGLIAGICLGWLLGYQKKPHAIKSSLILGISLAIVTAYFLSVSVVKAALLIFF
ncbi:MAG TPA: rhomboid family intramembrane serine protease [Desulfobacteraceae bacterium]|nr:rhomboid family intramembrane serine protease [Desulfobacteraceae bacterium]|tara:strand:+ start:830 stop:1534 length:705 start_codon:yes stop_codon:yes gene_type:complete